MKDNPPVVFGEAALSPTKKGSTMSLGNSRYVRKPVKKNPWREVEVSESNLIDALGYAMKFSGHIKSSERIERVIVGEPVSGQYPLSVAVTKRKED